MSIEIQEQRRPAKEVYVATCFGGPCEGQRWACPYYVLEYENAAWPDLCGEPEISRYGEPEISRYVFSRFAMKKPGDGVADHTGLFVPEFWEWNAWVHDGERDVTRRYIEQGITLMYWLGRAGWRCW